MTLRLTILCDAVGPGGGLARRIRRNCYSYPASGKKNPTAQHVRRVEAARREAARMAFAEGWVHAGRLGWKCPHCKGLGTTDE